MKLLKILILLCMPIYIYAGVTSALLGGAVGYSIGSSGKKEPVLNSDFQNYNQKCHLESGTYLTCIDQSRKMVKDMSNNPTDLRKYQASIKINDFNAPILLFQNFVGLKLLILSEWRDE